MRNERRKRDKSCFKDLGAPVEPLPGGLTLPDRARLDALEQAFGANCLARRDRAGAPLLNRNLFASRQCAKTEAEMKKARQRRAFAYVLPETRQPTRTVSGDEDCQAIYTNFTAPRLNMQDATFLNEPNRGPVPKYHGPRRFKCSFAARPFR